MANTRPNTPAPAPGDLSAFLVSGDAGTLVFKPGDPAGDVYLVQRGRVELVTQSGGSSRAETLGLGDFFGEEALLDEQARTQTAKALTAFTLVKLDRATFRQLAAANGEIAARMLYAIIARDRERPIAVEPPPPKPAAPPPPTPKAKAAPVEPPPKRSVEKAVLTHNASKKTFDLAPGTHIVGRQDRGTGFVPEVDLTELDTDRTLSRRHAFIVWRDGAFFVHEEKATRNGTFVNGQRVAGGAGTELNDGDRLRCGLVELVFRAT